MINDEIVVKVIKDDKAGLRLAIDAPPEVKIVRGEICEAEKGKKQDAAR